MYVLYGSMFVDVPYNLWNNNLKIDNIINYKYYRSLGYSRQVLFLPKHFGRNTRDTALRVSLNAISPFTFYDSTVLSNYVIKIYEVYGYSAFCALRVYYFAINRF